jgi:hypothetical protein
MTNEMAIDMNPSLGFYITHDLVNRNNEYSNNNSITMSISDSDRELDSFLVSSNVNKNKNNKNISQKQKLNRILEQSKNSTRYCRSRCRWLLIFIVIIAAFICGGVLSYFVLSSMYYP